ncbi:MAG: hypothetical protein WCE36_28985 [Pseudolabrys sp.]
MSGRKSVTGYGRTGKERSFQFGRASAPIAPQIVQTMRGPKEGTVTPSAKPLASSVARGDCSKPRRR